MNNRLFFTVLTLLMIVGSVFAYSGFNREYYTYNYQPSYYYATPYSSYTYTTYYPTSYAYTTYSNYYPNYSYVNMTPNYVTYYSTAYPAYYSTTYVSPAYTYPTSYRNLYIYKNNDGWGLGISTGSICGIYGYC
ncbi:MAG: hypothetical protein PHP82_03895 [Candidatus ainarchaeum sp.]|nr:hypothetical protein [Candidatus ainarchaeum sp.]